MTFDSLFQPDHHPSDLILQCSLQHYLYFCWDQNNKKGGHNSGEICLLSRNIWIFIILQTIKYWQMSQRQPTRNLMSVSPCPYDRSHNFMNLAQPLGWNSLLLGGCGLRVKCFEFIFEGVSVNNSNCLNLISCCN